MSSLIPRKIAALAAGLLLAFAIQPVIALPRCEHYFGFWNVKNLTVPKVSQSLVKKEALSEIDLWSQPSEVIDRILSVDRKFDSKEWKNEIHCIPRKLMLGSFVRERSVIGMTKAEVYSLLGPPDRDWAKRTPDRYRTNTEWYSVAEARHPRSLRTSIEAFFELGYSKDKVIGYRVMMTKNNPYIY